MITPIIVAKSPPSGAFKSAWLTLNERAADWYAQVTGTRPALGPYWYVPYAPYWYMPAPLSGSTTKAAEIELAALHIAEQHAPASIVFADVHTADGFGHRDRCAVIGGNNVHALVLGNPPNISLWILLHEWGHMFGLDHPPVTYAGEPDRYDTIMGYGSAGPFERDPHSVGFTPQEIAQLRQHKEFQPVTSSDLWYPGAHIYNGPAIKTTGRPFDAHGVTMHSMTGRFDVAMQMLQDVSRNARGHYSNPVSWHFSIKKNGTIYQHYPLNVGTWHSGTAWGNDNTASIEHEGGPPSYPSEPLTGAQLASSIDLVHWILARKGLTPSRGTTIFGHGDMGATLCPSGRIPFDRYVINTAPAPQPSEEDEVQTKPLTQSQAIAFFNKIAEELGELLGTSSAEGFFEITGGFPVPPGKRSVIVTIDEEAVADILR